MGDDYTNIEDLLNEARHHIDGGVDSTTHEYQALDKLERALSDLLEVLRRKG